MKTVLSSMCIVSLFLVALIVPVHADDAFHITYQQENVASNGGILSGDLIVTAVNASGESVQDVVISIPGPNNVTFDNDPIMIGDIVDGEQAGAIHAINAPEELQTGDAPDEVTWTVEFTDSLGARTEVEVVGTKVQ